MAASWSYQDEMFLREVVHADEEPAQSIEYETLVLLGPEPLDVKDALWGLLGVCICLLSAAGMVGGLALLLQLSRKIL
jgi:hypothetical protein